MYQVYTVFHKQDGAIGVDEGTKCRMYLKVARVLAGSLEDVFHATNHIDSEWTSNPLVEVLNGMKHRSTSVGDYVVDEEGNTFVVKAMGWEKV